MTINQWLAQTFIIAIAAVLAGFYIREGVKALQRKREREKPRVRADIRMLFNDRKPRKTFHIWL